MEGSGNFLRSTCLFIDSEKKRKHAEDEMIKIENIKGKLILLGAAPFNGFLFEACHDHRIHSFRKHCSFLEALGNHREDALHFSF